VAQIIECPACSTRYKINKAIPEAGRNVKCARCAHQWKLTPADALPDDDETEAASPPHSEPQTHGRTEPEGAGTHDFASAEPNDAVPEQSHFGHDAPSYDESPETPADEEDWSPPPGDSRPRMSALSQPVTATHDDPEDEAVQPALSEEESAALQGRRSWWKRGQPAETASAGRGQAYPMPSGAYEVPADEYEGEAPNEPTAESGGLGAMETPAPAADENWSSRFMGRAWKSRGVETTVEEEEDEDPETIIRETFRSALERTDEEQHPAAADAADNGQNASPFGSIYDAEWNRSGDEDGEVDAGRGSEPGFRQPQADYDDEAETDRFAATGHGEIDANEEPQQAFYAEEDDIDAPAFLRRGPVADEPELEETYRSEPHAYDAYEDEDDQEDDRARIARFAPQNAPFDERDGTGEDFDDKPNVLAGSGKRQAYDSLYGDQFDDAADRQDTENGLNPLMGLDEDEDRDDTDDIYGPAPQGSSGLAVAAGWVAYLSLAGGLLLGAVSFRQDVMAALPGTVNLYRMLGYDVALNKVDFASVDYQWNEIDGRPAIELRGEVVNITDETVRVPPVVVNVQSSSGANLIAEASVPTDELGPRDSATFTLELVSPPEDVTRIELEFAPGG
jgi:predicted Zn finger-like uncharacterized protein